nr:PREDICTED: actin-binding Rho-activating protein-like [Bemisia tabaci]
MTDAVFDSLAQKINKFNTQVNKHCEGQSLNPFSGSFQGDSRSPSPRPRFSKEEYGRPVAGSETERRGKKAHTHICREILELCTVIHDMGQYQAKHKAADDDDEEEHDGTIIVSFGELFQLYTKISDKVVGLLIAAKKKGLVYFEPEILFQRRDDNVLIALLKPMDEIKRILTDQAPSIAPSIAVNGGSK